MAFFGGNKSPYTGFRILELQDTGDLGSWILNPGSWTPDPASRSWIQDPVLRILGPGSWTQDLGTRILKAELFTNICSRTPFTNNPKQCHEHSFTNTLNVFTNTCSQPPFTKREHVHEHRSDHVYDDHPFTNRE